MRGMERGLGCFRWPLQSRRRRRDVEITACKFLRRSHHGLSLHLINPIHRDGAGVAFSVFVPVELRIIETIAQP